METKSCRVFFFGRIRKTAALKLWPNICTPSSPPHIPLLRPLQVSPPPPHLGCILTGSPSEPAPGPAVRCCSNTLALTSSPSTSRNHYCLQRHGGARRSPVRAPHSRRSRSEPGRGGSVLSGRREALLSDLTSVFMTH